MCASPASRWHQCRPSLDHVRRLGVSRMLRQQGGDAGRKLGRQDRAAFVRSPPPLRPPLNPRIPLVLAFKHHPIPTLPPPAHMHHDAIEGHGPVVAIGAGREGERGGLPGGGGWGVGHSPHSRQTGSRPSRISVRSLLPPTQNSALHVQISHQRAPPRDAGSNARPVTWKRPTRVLDMSIA